MDVGPWVEIPAFVWRWPKYLEHFSKGREASIAVDGHQTSVRHGLGSRHAFAKERVHTVTWLFGSPMVEGVEADDYANSRSLLSLLRLPDKRHVATTAAIPSGYTGFEVVRHDVEIVAPRSWKSLVVKIREDDLNRWARHAGERWRSKQAQN